jgi:hypothetical protein
MEIFLNAAEAGMTSDWPSHFMIFFMNVRFTLQSPRLMSVAEIDRYTVTCLRMIFTEKYTNLYLTTFLHRISVLS